MGKTRASARFASPRDGATPRNPREFGSPQYPITRISKQTSAALGHRAQYGLSMRAAFCSEWDLFSPFLPKEDGLVFAVFPHQMAKISSACRCKLIQIRGDQLPRAESTLHLLSVNTLMNPSFHPFYCIFCKKMHSLMKTSLLMLTALCVLEAAPNSPNTADQHPTVPLPGIMTFQVQIGVRNEKFLNAVLRSPAGTCHPVHVDQEAKKFSVYWTQCGVVDAADLEHITIDIQNDLDDPKLEGQVDPVHSVKLPVEQFEQFFAGGAAEIVIKPARRNANKPAGSFDYNVTYLHGLPGTLKFTVDHQQLGKENALEFIVVVAGETGAFRHCKHTMISTNPLQFTVNWAEVTCLKKYGQFMDVQIQLKFKNMDVQKINFLYYEPMLNHLYVGGEAKLTLHYDYGQKQKAMLKYVKYPSGESVPQPGIMFFNVEMERKTERFQMARIENCRVIKGQGSNFIVDWSNCDAVDEDDLRNVRLGIENKLDPRKPRQMNPSYNILFEKFSREKLKQIINGGEAKIFIREGLRATHELTVLGGPKSVAETNKAGTITFVIDFKQLGEGVKDFHVKSVQASHRLFGECKTQMHHSNGAKFSINWAECQREVLGHYNLLDVKFRLDFSHGKPRFIELANYSHSLLKHMYAGGEAHIVMHQNEKQKPEITYVKYPTGMIVPQPKLLTINVEMENKNERFKHAEIRMMPGECKTIKGDGPTFVVDWSLCEVVDASDVHLFEFDIGGLLKPKYTVYFENFTEETLKHLFEVGEAKILLRQEFGAKHEFSYLNGPKSGEKTINAGTVIFSMDYKAMIEDMKQKISILEDKAAMEKKLKQAMEDYQVKNVQTLHRRFGECKTKMHHSTEDFTVKFSINWAECQREMLGAYNLLDVKFQVDFNSKYVKPRFIELSEFSNSLRKHLYAGGEAHIAMYKENASKPTSITYVKYPNGSDVLLPKTLTINVQFENKKESFKKAEIFTPGGEIDIAKSTEFALNWTDYGVVEAEDLRHFWLYIHGETDFGAEKKPDDYVQPVHAIGFVDLSKEELGHLFVGGEAKLLIRDTKNGPKPTLFLNLDKHDEPEPKSVIKHPGPLHFNMNYDKLGPNVHFESINVGRYNFMTECETEVGQSAKNHRVKFTVKSWTKCAPNIGDMNSLYFKIKFAKMEGEEKKEFVHKSNFYAYPSTLLEHFYVGGEADLEIFDEKNSAVTYIKHLSGKPVQRPGILTINMDNEIKNEHFHSADIVVPEGLARTAHNGKKAFYANWDRLQLVSEEDLRNFRINVHSLLANKPDGLIHSMHTVWFKHYSERQLKQLYDGGKAKFLIQKNQLPILAFMNHSAGLIQSGILHPGTVKFHLEFANKKQTLAKAQIHSQFGLFEAENGHGPDSSFNIGWSKTGIVFEEEIEKTTIYITIKQASEPNILVKIALNELYGEMRKQFYAGGLAKILIRNNQAHEGQILIKPEDITIVNGPYGSGAFATEWHHDEVAGSNSK